MDDELDNPKRAVDPNPVHALLGFILLVLWFAFVFIDGGWLGVFVFFVLLPLVVFGAWVFLRGIGAAIAIIGAILRGE